MGGWGYQSDANDSVQDYLIDLFRRVTPEGTEFDDDSNKKLKNAYKKDKTKYFKNVLTVANKIAKGNKTHGGLQFSGVVLGAIKKINNGKLPSKLPEGFPESLRKKTVKMLQKAFEEIYTQGWKDPYRRANEVNKELALFSKGKEGKGKNKLYLNEMKLQDETFRMRRELQKTGKRPSTKRSRKRSTSSSRKRKSRSTSIVSSRRGSLSSQRQCRYKGDEPSPKGFGFCARNEKLGRIRKGTDGNNWIVKQRKNGSRFWSRKI